MGTGGSFRGLKWPGYEFNHSSPSIAEIRNEWIFTSTLFECFYEADRDDFTMFSGTVSFNKLSFHNFLHILETRLILIV